MFYVTTTDSFMSGWGPATGLKNRLIILCDTEEEAKTVCANARGRTDQYDVGYSSEPPPYFHKKWKKTGSDYETGNLYVQIKTKADLPNWFKPGTWSRP